jgi:hypothetical protein
MNPERARGVAQLALERYEVSGRSNSHVRLKMSNHRRVTSAATRRGEPHTKVVR